VTPEGVGIVDLTAMRQPGCISTHWKPSPEELETLAQGGLIRLTILGEQHPPVMLQVVDMEEKKDQ
jgi:hypothetical protein